MTKPPDATPGSAARNSEKKERAPFELPDRDALYASANASGNASANASVITPPDDFLARAGDAGISFEPGDVERLGLYLAYLLHANERMNLTGIRDADEAWTRHILDALTLLAPLSELADGSAVLDIGSGGGVPGIPLAIVLPAMRFSLLEATSKKANFLTQVAAKLDLGNVEVLNDRAEHAAADGSPHRAHFDAVVARAVGPLRVVAELAVPFGKVGSLVLLIKGERAEDELLDARKALHALHTTHAGTIETPTGRIVVLEKRRDTPRIYPRKVGDPKRSPL